MDSSECEESPDETQQAIELERHRIVVRRLLSGLLFLSLLYTLYFARPLLMPVVVALLVSLLLSPLVAWLKAMRIPRPISALLLICLLGVPFVWLSIQLAEPAKKWMEKLPEISIQVNQQLEDISDSLKPETPPPVASPPVQPQPVKKSGFTFFGLFEDAAVAPVVAVPVPEPEAESALVEGVKQGGAEIILSMLAAAPIIVAQCAIWLILVLFLLIFGPGLYDSVIDLLPMIRDKRRAIVLVGRLRQELSRYIVTVTMINAGLGVVTASVLWFMGVEDAVLWGALVALLNYAPYVGPLIAIGVLGMAGLAQYGMDISALLPAAIFIIINVVESELVTPTLLGKHMKLNPLVLIFWLLIWGWLWGPIGVLIAVPLLLCLKLVAAQSEKMNYWVQLIETES